MPLMSAAMNPVRRQRGEDWDRRTDGRLITNKQHRRTQNVLVSHQDGLIDLSLSGPAGLVGGEEHFDGNLFAPPLSHPHLPVAALAYLLHHLDLFGDRPLHLR